jgi:predicted dehydrogenase
MRSYPESLAIAGAWGYIGRKFLDAALRRRIRTLVFDPGDPPADVDSQAIAQIGTEEEFYASRVDLFHLAMHPGNRQRGLDLLLARAAGGEDIAVLNEKPMAAPESPEQCPELVDRTNQSGALMLFDFTELYDPMTERIIEHLRPFRDLRINDIYIRRSKDREAPGNPRNYKPMVPIQYQESIHCLAFVLFVLARLRGDLASVFEHGLTMTGDAKPYQPPNPEIYPYVVDGRCNYRLALGTLSIEGQTDFKAGADATKQRILSGTGDGRPFHIDVDFQEGRKRLLFNGMDQTGDPAARFLRPRAAHPDALAAVRTARAIDDRCLPQSDLCASGVSACQRPLAHLPRRRLDPSGLARRTAGLRRQLPASRPRVCEVSVNSQAD